MTSKEALHRMMYETDTPYARGVVMHAILFLLLGGLQFQVGNDAPINPNEYVFGPDSHSAVCVDPTGRRIDINWYTLDPKELIMKMFPSGIVQGTRTIEVLDHPYSTGFGGFEELAGHFGSQGALARKEEVDTNTVELKRGNDKRQVTLHTRTFKDGSFGIETDPFMICHSSASEAYERSRNRRKEKVRKYKQWG